MNWSTVGTVILGSGGLVTGVLALFSSKSNRNKVDSETSVNAATAAQSRESLSQSREKFIQDELNSVRATLQHEISCLKQEVGWMRRLIELHVPWDWEAVRKLTLAGVDIANPPTLNYIRESTEE